MGQSKGGGYTQKSNFQPGQQGTLDSVNQFAQQNLSGQGLSQDPLYQQAIQAIQGFLPGGQGFAPIQAEAQRNFKEQTIPSIMNAFGTGNKGSSALNNSLASAGSNLNSSLASMLAQMQLGAAGQATQTAGAPYGLGLQGSQQSLGAQPFSHLQRQTPAWQSILETLISAGGQAIGGTH